MGAIEGAEQGRRTRARLHLGQPGSTVETGIPALDHLLGLAATSGGFGLSLEVAPGAPVQEVADAGRAVGDELAGPLRADGVRGLGSAREGGGARGGVNREATSPAVEMPFTPPRLASLADPPPSKGG